MHTFTTAAACSAAIAEFRRIHALHEELSQAQYDDVYDGMELAIGGQIRTIADAVAVIAAIIASANANDGILEPDHLLALERARALLAEIMAKT